MPDSKTISSSITFPHSSQSHDIKMQSKKNISLRKICPLDTCFVYSDQRKEYQCYFLKQDPENTFIAYTKSTRIRRITSSKSKLKV